MSGSRIKSDTRKPSKTTPQMNLFPLKLRVLELLMPRFDIITMISALTTRRKHPLCRYTARALGCKWAFYSPCQGEKFTRRHSFCAFRDLFCSRRDCRTKCVCVLNKCSFFPGCIPESTYSQALKKKTTCVRDPYQQLSGKTTSREEKVSEARRAQRAQIRLTQED